MQYYKRGSLARFMSSLSYQNLGVMERLKLAVQVGGGAWRACLQAGAAQTALERAKDLARKGSSNHCSR
jgi:hypothetical protein